MKDDRLANIEAHRLASLLDFEDAATGGWLQADLAGMLQHQLHAPLVTDELATPLTAESLSAAHASSHSHGCFADLLHDSQPSLMLLQLVKRFAKLSLGSEPGPLPGEVAAVLYYLSIALAHLHHEQRISGLDNTQLCEGLRWIVEQPWVTKEIKAVATEGLSSLARESP